MKKKKGLEVGLDEVTEAEDAPVTALNAKNNEGIVVESSHLSLHNRVGVLFIRQRRTATKRGTLSEQRHVTMGIQCRKKKKRDVQEHLRDDNAPCESPSKSRRS